MNAERGADCRGLTPNGRRCSPGAVARDVFPPLQRPTAFHHAAAFTLVELLVVVAIIAIMSSLLTPAVRGLLGVSGPRGGVNTLSAALEQARLAAMQSGVPAYAGLAVDTNGGHSAVIVFRDPREGEPNAPVAVTRWIKMPQGVYHKSEDLETFAVQPQQFPRLGTNRISSLSVVRFDRFGRLAQTATNKVIQLGAMAEQNGPFIGGDKNYFEVTIHPLTGRASVVDMAMGGTK